MAKNSDYKVRTMGKGTKRISFSKAKHELEAFDLLQDQKKSFNWFLEKGINQTLQEIYPIKSNNDKIQFNYVANSAIVEFPEENEFQAIKKAKQKGSTYSGIIKARISKMVIETGEIEEAEVSYGNIPLITSGGSFIVNGSEKVIISQLIRSSGAYFGRFVRNKQADDLFNKVEIIPRMGSWIEISHRVTGNITDTVKIKIDKNKSILLTTFLSALGMRKNTIKDLFGNSKVLIKTLKQDKYDSEVQALEQIYSILRRGDRITEEVKKNLIPSILFNARRYNLSKTGRFMLNRKLNLIDRIIGTYLAEDITTSNSKNTKISILFKKGILITNQIAREIQDNFNKDIISSTNIPDITEKVYENELQLSKNPKLKLRTKIISVKIFPNKESINKKKNPILIIGNDPKTTERHLVISDIVAIVSYYFNLIKNIGKDDDPDSLYNKRIVGVGELLQNQFKIGLTKLEKNAKERMASKEIEKITPKNITNSKPVYNQFKTFFNSSKLSQFMDQINPLSEISNKRRVTSLGPGGLNRDTAQFEVRDVHSTHYGRICPIETPEGPNIGLILNFATYSRVNEYGFIETPYYKVTNGIIDYKNPVFLTAASEKGLNFAQFSIKTDAKNKIIEKQITIRRGHEYSIVKPSEIDYVDVSSKQMTSIAASAIPFLENNDANRALMGSNMQRQAVPLILSEAPLIATGIESDIARFSASNITSTHNGIITYSDAKKIVLKTKKEIKKTYYLKNFQRSNQGTIINQKPLVKKGDKIKKGDILVDGASFDNGELAIGKNILVAFSTWKGYNYEDAIIISERLVRDDIFTSIHIEEQSIMFRHSKVGDDVLTNEIPNASKISTRFLDSNGIVRVGSEVSAGDILVGRTSPKGEENLTAEEKLIAAIFSQKPSNNKDTSLKVKNGHNGTVINVEILSRANKDLLEDSIDKIVKVFIAQKRKIKVGDKMAGRHGNKGVISIVLPIEDMPHLEDGTPIDIILNPQGVPSRMNIGQVLEMHLGMAAKHLGTKYLSPVFDGVSFDKIQDLLEKANKPREGKFTLIDPISGQPLREKISVGVMYMVKLNHMIDDKMHARSIGPYSLITQQPLGGKSQNGGQRFGEMETWAIESYGATNVLQELLTYKSDNIQGRNRLYNALSTGKKLPTPGTPESFNVLAYELRGLGIKLEIHKKEKNREQINE